MRLKSHRATFKQTKPNTSTVEKLTRLDSLLPYQQAKLVNVALIYCHTSMFTCTCALMSGHAGDATAGQDATSGQVAS